MTTAPAAALSRAKKPPAITAKPTPRAARKRTTAKARIAKPSDLEAIRNALPFFKPGRGKTPACWWNVTPTGNYSDDLNMGKACARAFLPLLTFNAGASDLVVIVSDMARAGHDPAKNPKKWRGIDNVASGFLMEIAGALQAAIVGIGVATVAIKTPGTDLGAKFVELVEAGDVLNNMGRNTLFHDPNASIFEKRT